VEGLKLPFVGFVKRRSQHALWLISRCAPENRHIAH